MFAANKEVVKRKRSRDEIDNLMEKTLLAAKDSFEQKSQSITEPIDNLYILKFINLSLYKCYFFSSDGSR